MYSLPPQKKYSSFGVTGKIKGSYKENKELTTLLPFAGYIISRQEVAFCEYKQENSLLLSLWTCLRQLRSTPLHDISEKTKLTRYQQKKIMNVIQENDSDNFKPHKTRTLLNEA